ncbi:two-component system response regulator [Thauera sp. 27]|uniref:HD-GYP domain-containing protein n=1 Tax=Thauera sp. 27 TaxID=305700 RepID=UPI0002D0E22C|nr:two-component system response regulator [Thauera sp. 27]ENO81772.1 two-component system response regulator [Thauera sp. 27]
MSEASRNTILAIDDAPENLRVLSEVLRPHYRVLVATSGAVGLELAAGPKRPDLILLDIMMPGMDGYEVLTRLRENPLTQGIPVIFLTAMTAVEDEEHGLGLGAADYVGKPFKPALLLARVRTQLENKLARDWMQDQNAALEREVGRRMAENLAIQKISIRALAHLAETRDPETGNHILRTQNYVQLLADALRHHHRFARTLTAGYIDLLVLSAPLHDIGKVGIPDHILLKPGKLTPDEWAIMQTHAALGSDAILRAEQGMERAPRFLTLAREIARHHHEKWNGDGYPDALAGDDIPLSARIMALADVFDALISPRVYKPAMSFEDARSIIVSGRGIHFDPDVVDAFTDRFDDFVAIAERYGEEAEAGAAPLRTS